MKFRTVSVLLVLMLGMMIAASQCWAKENGYNYIIAYSFKDKIAYHTPVFVQTVKGESYNEEEYVSDTASLIKMETAFQKYLEKNMQLNSFNFTISARVAFKSEEIAKKRLDKEAGDFRFKGFTIQEISVFKYKE